MLTVALLALIGISLVTLRLFLNGLKQSETVGLQAPAPESVAAAVPAPPPAAGTSRKRSARPSAAAAPREEQCLACGWKAYPGAKFCGECGRRLGGEGKR